MADEPEPMPAKSTVSRRLTREGRWTPEVIQERDRLLAHARDVLGMAKEKAQQWAYEALGDKYPPLPEGEIVRKTRGKAKKSLVANGLEEMGSQAENGEKCHQSDDKGAVGDAKKPRARAKRSQIDDTPDSSLVVGLNRIPASWPPLPPNSTLAVEIQWVQAVRIDVVEELPTGGTVVRLDRAERPAPSKAALGWLETSIRAYAKYCDIAAKAASSYEDEREIVRRERQSIEQVRAILAEMVADPPRP